jgi:hypothetical protein
VELPGMQHKRKSSIGIFQAELVITLRFCGYIIEKYGNERPVDILTETSASF